MQSFILPSNGKATPDSIARKRRMAEAMMASGMETGPVGHWTQGAARMAQALAGGMASRRADEQDAEGQQSARDAMTKALMGGDKAAMLDAVNNPFMSSAGMEMVGGQWDKMNQPPPNPELKDLKNGQFFQYDPRDPQGSGQAFTPDGYNPEMAGNDAEYGLQPIVTQEGPNDPNPGKYHLFQPSRAGEKPKEIELPYGWTPKMQFLNQETQFAPVATQGVLQPGQGPAPVPINNAQAAADTKIGGETGEAAVLYHSLASKMPGLKKVVSDLGVLADQATYTSAGQLYDYTRKELGAEPREAAIARAKYIAMVDNQVLPMLRDTFGAQFTVVEGETLRKTLGDPNKAPAEKKAVLNAFIEQKVRNMEAAAQQGNVQTPEGQPQTTVPQSTPDFSTMSDEELEAIINGQ